MNSIYYAVYSGRVEKLGNVKYIIIAQISYTVAVS